MWFHILPSILEFSSDSHAKPRVFSRIASAAKDNRILLTQAKDTAQKPVDERTKASADSGEPRAKQRELMLPKHKTLCVLAAAVLVCSAIACAARNDAGFVEIQRSQKHATQLWLNAGSYKRIASNVQRITLSVLGLVDESSGAQWRLGLSYPQRELVVSLQRGNETVVSSTSIAR